MKPAHVILAIAAATLALAACDKAKNRQPATADQPAAATATAPPMPAPPAWLADYAGKPFQTAFPGPLGTCVGNTDNVEVRYGGSAPGVEIVGWGWEPATKAPVPRVILVDAAGLIIGAGETGVTRPDVNKALPKITSTTTGWKAFTAAVHGPVDAYGLVAGGKSICRLGHLAY